MTRFSMPGFTLPELLIIAEIATFTIPKVLQSQQSSRNLAVAKETAAMVSEAYQLFRYRNTLSAATSLNDLTPYMNYVKVETAASVDHKQTFTLASCSGVTCLKLHNGGTLWYDAASGYSAFGGTATTNCVFFVLDPDGVYGNSTTGQSKAVEFALYTDGALRTDGSLRTNSYTGYGATGPANASYDPTWFSW